MLNWLKELFGIQDKPLPWRVPPVMKTQNGESYVKPEKTDCVNRKYTAEELGKMTKAELLDFAELKGTDVKKSWTKAKIIEALA